MRVLDAATSTFLVDESVAPLTTIGGEEQRYTTHDLLACEREIIHGARRRRGERTGVLPSASLDDPIAEQAVALNEDQAAAVREIISSGRGIDAVNALAGTGKTTMIAAAAAAYRREGWRVVGATPTARAARQLRDIAGIDAGTMDSLAGCIAPGGGLDERSVLVLDEAGMAPTRLTAGLLAHAEQTGAKVIAVGHPGQLREAGGWLAVLTREETGPALLEVMRQRDPGEQDALRALHDGDPNDYFERKRHDITVHETEVDALATLSDSWHQAQVQYGRRQAVMIARTNLSRERHNRAARAKLKRFNQLGERDVIIGGRGYAAGDHSETGSTLLETDSDEPRALDPEYVARHLEHAYALTAHGAQGGTFRRAGVTGPPDEFTREWAYAALSRARGRTILHLISQRSERDRERDEYAPAQPDLDSEQTRTRVRQALARSEAEPLATERLGPGPQHRPSPQGPRSSLTASRCCAARAWVEADEASASDNYRVKLCALVSKTRRSPLSALISGAKSVKISRPSGPIVRAAAKPVSPVPVASSRIVWPGSGPNALSISSETARQASHIQLRSRSQPAAIACQIS
jgi:hypothetical protein